MVISALHAEQHRHSNPGSKTDQGHEALGALKVPTKVRHGERLRGCGVSTHSVLYSSCDRQTRIYHLSKAIKQARRESFQDSPRERRAASVGVTEAVRWGHGQQRQRGKSELLDSSLLGGVLGCGYNCTENQRTFAGFKSNLMVRGWMEVERSHPFFGHRPT